MARLTEVTLSDAQALVAAYGLELASVEPLSQGSVNSNLKLVTTGGARFFARVYEEQEFSGAETELRLLSALSDSGVPVVRALETSSRQRVLAFHGKPFAVFPWVDGDWLCLKRVTPAHLKELGSALAKVHLASDRVGALPEGRFTPEQMLLRLERVEREGEETLHPHVSRIRELYAKVLPHVPKAAERGVCHGDLFRDNVIWNGGTLRALIDFESACFGSFMYDLAVTALAWCYTDHFVSEHVHVLFQGYARVRRPSDVEIASLEVEASLACLRFATTRLTDFELRTPAGHTPARDFRRFLTRFEAIEQGKLAPFLRSLERGNT